MKCPYCAEEIQDAAILCRFCGATRGTPADSQTWLPPLPGAHLAASAPPQRPNFTLQFAAVFFFFSAIYACFSLTSPAPLFGALRGGLVAIFYNAIFAALFFAMGLALWQPRPWGYWMMLWGTVFYTIAKLVYLCDTGAQQAAVQSDDMAMINEYLGADMAQTLAHIPAIVAVISIACWWGFMFYLHRKRSLFTAPR